MNEEQVRIRYAIGTDAQRIIELLVELDRPLPKDRNEKRKFRMLISSYIDLNFTQSNRGIIVATIGSKIIGLVSYALLDRLNQLMRKFWIPELVVSKEFRNQGTDKLLARKCELIAKRKKCYRISLESRNDRIQSHNFYKKIGFRQIALIFERRLSRKNKKG
jgi:ribosomal protein S18 acetylase RimI-like enzyme